MILWLLLSAAEPAIETPPDPFGTLRGSVVEAIRDCGTTATGEIKVCSPDRGYAERERRVKKLKKPKPVPSDIGIKFEVVGGPDQPPPDRGW